MTHGMHTPGDPAPFKRGSRKALAQPLLCGAALLLSTTLGLFFLYRPGETVEAAVAAPVVPAQTKVADPALVPQPAAIAHVRAAHSMVPAPPALPHLRRDVAMLDPRLTADVVPMAFARSGALRAGFVSAALTQPSTRIATPVPAPGIQLASLEQPATETKLTDVRPIETDAVQASAVPEMPESPVVAPALAPDVADVPLPMPRPAFPRLDASKTEAPAVAPSRRAAPGPVATRPMAPAETAEAPSSGPSFFDKLFRSPSAGRNVLAYAAPEDGAIGRGIGGRMPSRDGYTAVYEITTHTVHMPNGQRLEAHSGLGPYLDNPAGIPLRMQGPTPPSMYQLSLRESLFHGVQAIRLTPMGGGNTYGRTGLLAHTFMLGPRGDSNGCISFRDYGAFLAAYQAGQIRRVMVVERL